MVSGGVTAHPDGFFRGYDGSAEASLPAISPSLTPEHEDQASFQEAFKAKVKQGLLLQS
jgi:hypothetical protein